MNVDNDMNELAASYSSEYAKLIEQHLGRKLELSDGLPDVQIRTAEKILGFQFLVSLRDYYKIAGNLSELNK